jgi:hypothetical protein
MATEQKAPKILRIGVIQGGKIVEERVMPARQAVSVGTSTRNTVVVPQSNLPESVTVLEWEGDQYLLRFAEPVAGRIRGPGGAVELAALVASGQARKEARGFALPLTDDLSGKIAIGQVTLLWQFVEPLAEQPRPELPPEARGNHFKSMDRLFTWLLLASFALHTGVYVALAGADLPPEATIEEIPDRYARLLIPEKVLVLPCTIICQFPYHASAAALCQVLQSEKQRQTFFRRRAGHYSYARFHRK